VATEAIIFQQIVDVNWDQAIYTASPNNTINVAQFAAKGSGTNIGIALTPKGTGYISAQVPDGTVAGGNARGANAVDLQTSRNGAAQVASGNFSVIAGGLRNAASGAESCVCGGNTNTASGDRATVVSGSNNLASGARSVAGGTSCTSSGVGSFCIGESAVASGSQSIAAGNIAEATGAASASFGIGSNAHRTGMLSVSSARYATGGDRQSFIQTLGATTTTNAEVEMLPRLPPNTEKMTVRAGTVLHMIVSIVGAKSDGSEVAKYTRQVTIKRVVNTTTMVGSPEVVGADLAAGTSIAITADDTNDCLRIGVTGVSSETWRWVAMVKGAELGIGA
jgi:hypothetical protein